MEALKACPDPGSLRDAIDTLPTELGDMYELRLARINSRPGAIATMARLALVWVSRARRRLKVRELFETVATSYTPGWYVPGKFREDRMHFPRLRAVSWL